MIIRSQHTTQHNVTNFSLQLVILFTMPVQTERCVNHFGIEVADSVTWQGWEPGGEYTQQIVLKNVQIKTQKLQYK